MRQAALPLRPKADNARLRSPQPPSRKVFNCIVDDTALIAGAKRSTRDGLRKWISNGQIRLFVPLHTLDQLDRLKKGNDRRNTDSREAIKWLDDITSMPAVHTSGLVQLEGAEEMYNTWEEVEAFLLPETLLSMDYSESEDESISEDLDSSANPLDTSDLTSMTSSVSLEDRPKTPASSRSIYSSGSPKSDPASPYKKDESVKSAESPAGTARNSAELSRAGKSSKSTVPAYLQPLFNHILWRIHQEQNADAALESYILLTNDTAKQAIAQRFGIRAKRLEQLRDAVAREDRDFKNRLLLYRKETEGNNDPSEKLPTAPAAQKVPENVRPATKTGEGASDDEDVILFKRAPRGPQATNGQRVFDPNDFGRTNQHNHARGGRGGRGGRSTGRGAYVPPAPFRSTPAPRGDPSQPIDPDSYTRPPPRTSTLRGGRRKLWEPM